MNSDSQADDEAYENAPLQFAADRMSELVRAAEADPQRAGDCSCEHPEQALPGLHRCDGGLHLDQGGRHIFIQIRGEIECEVARIVREKIFRPGQH